tara:strand:- start:89 stop:343 length:255 start_codon:yes stop_codon:yes gene_type:complete
MKTIKYNNKLITLPFPDADYGIDPLEAVVIKNRFGFGEAAVPTFAAAVYDVIMGSEMLEQWEDHAKGLDWFRQYFPEQYMVLLD